jgi:PTS system ascorbate-specific IIC component
MVGLILQKKQLDQIVKGTLKTVLGFLILNLGVSAVTGSLSSFDKLFKAAFNIQGIYLDDNLAVGAMMKTIGRDVSLVMILGFAVNIIVARFTPAKWIYLSGHKIWHLAGGLAFGLAMLGIGGWKLVLVGSLCLGIYMAVQPMLLQPLTKKVTGSDDFGIGHTMSSTIAISALIGKCVGKKDDSIEDIKLPEKLEFFRDMSVSFAIIMILMFAVPAIFTTFTDPAVLTELAGSQHPVVFIIIKSLTAAAGIMVILQGVRMFLGELIPAFKGLATKLVPGARPALDVPVVFPFGQTAVVAGLVSCFIGWIFGMFVAGALGLAVIAVPSMIGVMFGGTTSAVYGNALGGRRGAVIASLFCGLTWPIAAGLFYPVLDFPSYGIIGTGLLTPDIYIVVTIVKMIGSIFSIFT